MTLWLKTLMVSIGFVATFAAPVVAQEDKTEEELKKYRAMIADPFSNPGFLYVDRGAELWVEKRGSKNSSLETCDLGLGAGKVDGAFAQLPRYFADADKVMDLEARLDWCMVTIQGLDTAALRKKPFSSNNSGKMTDYEALVAFVSNKSSGSQFDAPLAHPKEKDMAALGEAMFYRRSGPFDFSCQTCHGAENQRIRLQALPYFEKPQDAQASMGSWPTYRVSQAQFRTMQHRLWDCMWQMRLPDVAFTSDITIALTTYLVQKAKGGTIEVPSIKR